MRPEAKALKEKFLKRLAFSLLISVFTNFFSSFLSIGIGKELDDPPRPLFKGEPLTMKKQNLGDTRNGKQYTEGGFPIPALPNHHGNSTKSPDRMPFDKHAIL